VGNRPPEPHQFTGHGHHHLVGLFAASDQAAVALTPPNLRLPAEILDGFGLLFEPQLQMSTHLGRIAIGPGTFNKSPTGLGIARFGHGTLATPLTGGIRRGHQPHAFHACSESLDARQVAAFGHRGDRYRDLYTAECLKDLDHRVPTPSFDLRLECLVETLEAFGMLVDRAAIFLEDHWRRRGGTDDFGAPPPMGGVPGGPAGIAAIVAEPQGFETERGGLESLQGIFTGAGEISAGFIFDLGDRDCGEMPRASQAGQWHGVPAVGVDPITGLLGNQRRRHHPAVRALVRQLAVEPGATGAGVVDEEQMFGLGWPLADELIAITLAGANGAKIGDLGTVLLRDVRHGNRVLVDVHPDGQRARLAQGCPPRVWSIVHGPMHEAALASGAHPRTQRRSAYPSEVIMSRCVLTDRGPE
jgi:hypothetical protein